RDQQTGRDRDQQRPHRPAPGHPVGAGDATRVGGDRLQLVSLGQPTPTLDDPRGPGQRQLLGDVGTAAAQPHQRGPRRILRHRREAPRVGVQLAGGGPVVRGLLSVGAGHGLVLGVVGQVQAVAAAAAERQAHRGTTSESCGSRGRGMAWPMLEAARSRPTTSATSGNTTTRAAVRTMPTATARATTATTGRTVTTRALISQATAVVTDSNITAHLRLGVETDGAGTSTSGPGWLGRWR